MDCEQGRNLILQAVQLVSFKTVRYLLNGTVSVGGEEKRGEGEESGRRGEEAKGEKTKRRGGEKCGEM